MVRGGGANDQVGRGDGGGRGRVVTCSGAREYGGRGNMQIGGDGKGGGCEHVLKGELGTRGRSVAMRGMPDMGANWGGRRGVWAGVAGGTPRAWGVGGSSRRDAAGGGAAGKCESGASATLQARRTVTDEAMRRVENAMANQNALPAHLIGWSVAAEFKMTNEMRQGHRLTCALLDGAREALLLLDRSVPPPLPTSMYSPLVRATLGTPSLSLTAHCASALQ